MAPIVNANPVRIYQANMGRSRPSAPLPAAGRPPRVKHRDRPREIQ